MYFKLRPFLVDKFPDEAVLIGVRRGRRLRRCGCEGRSSRAGRIGIEQRHKDTGFR